VKTRVSTDGLRAAKYEGGVYPLGWYYVNCAD